MFSKTSTYTNRNVQSTFSKLKDVVSYIKSTNRPEYETVLQARSVMKGSSDYNKLKAQMPCVVFNFKIDNAYCNKANCNTPTGYLYLDIDNYDDMSWSHHQGVCAYWKSLSGKGYSIVVKVEGLTIHNLKEYAKQIASELCIPYDNNAVSPERQVCLSYDDNPYYNPQATIFKYVQENKNKNTASRVYNKKNKDISQNAVISCKYASNRVIWDNRQEIVKEYDFNGSSFIDFGSDNKLKYAQVFTVHKAVKEGFRHKYLSMFLHQFICLNPHFNEQELWDKLRAVNTSACLEPLDEKRLRKIFWSKYNNRHSLEEINNRELRFLFNPECNLTNHEKMMLRNGILGQERSKKSQDKIKECLDCWDFNKYGLITLKKVQEVTTLSKRTIEKYSNIFKEYRKLLNELHIENKNKNTASRVYNKKNKDISQNAVIELEGYTDVIVSTLVKPTQEDFTLGQTIPPNLPFDVSIVFKLMIEMNPLVKNLKENLVKHNSLPIFVE